MKIRCDNQKSKKCQGRAMVMIEADDNYLKLIKFCPICGSEDIQIIPGTPNERDRLRELKIK